MGVRTIKLVPPDAQGWATRYSDAQARVALLLPAATIEHIGSTSVPDMPAKDVVDLLVGVDLDHWSAAMDVLSTDGFDCEGRRAGHAWFSLPDRRLREVVVHLVEIGGRQWNRRIAFREILRRDSQARARYLCAKREAAASAADWGTYTAHKAGVVAAILSSAGIPD